MATLAHFAALPKASDSLRPRVCDPGKTNPKLIGALVTFMHAINLIEVAATFVRQAEAQIALGLQPPRRAIHIFWLNYRYRYDSWSSRLAAHRTAIQQPGASYRNQQWYDIVPVIQDVLLSEPLTRCVAHQATVLEELELDADFAALAQSSLSAHVEARHRCLHMIVFGSGLPTELAVRLNRLRKICEAYTDQLLILLRPVEQTDVFSFDAPFVGASRSKLQHSASTDACRRLHTSALSQWFLRSSALDVDYRKASPTENEQITQSILGLMPKEIFDSFGVPMTQHAAHSKRITRDAAASPKYFAGKLSSPLDLLNMPVSRAVTSQPSDNRWRTP